MLKEGFGKSRKDYSKLYNSNLNIFFTFCVLFIKINQIPNFMQ